MSNRFPDAQLDLSLLPAPAVIKSVDFEAIKAERLADLKARLTAAGIPFNTGTLESEPGVKLQEVDGYREMLGLQDINDAAKAVMVLYAEGTDQDQLYAFNGVRRLLLRPADPTTNPPTPALYEGDDDFMLRFQVAGDGRAPGLVGGGYASIALRASPEVKRVSLVRGPEGSGRVAVVLQGRLIRDGGTADDGSVSDLAVRAVAAALADDWSDDASTGSQLTDIPMVRSAVPRPYDVVLRATVPSGPAYGLVQGQSEANLRAFAAGAQLVGNSVPTDALMAAGRIPSMIKAWLISPPLDVACAPDEVPWCRSVAVNVSIDS